jgi:hypothetical protein
VIAPTVPTGLAVAVVSATALTVSWDAAGGATGYDLERDGTVIAAGLTATSYADTGLTASTGYSYRVRSVNDGTSPTFAVLADTYVTASQPTNPQGTKDQLRVSGGSAEKISYLKFQVDGAQPGSPITAVDVTVTGYGTNGTTQTLGVYAVDPATWDETTTYNTRPALGAQVATGTLATTGTMTATVPVAGNGVYSVALTTTGTGDSVIASREHATGALRPSVTIGYGAPLVTLVKDPGETYVGYKPDTTYGLVRTTYPNGATKTHFELRAGEQWPPDIVNHDDGRQRAERKRTAPPVPFGTDLWISYSLRWQGTWPNSWIVITQTHQIPETTETAGKPPPWSLRVDSGTLNLVTRADPNLITGPTQIDDVIRYSRPWFSDNNWHGIVARVLFDPFGAGSTTFYIDGVQVYDSGPIPIGYNDVETESLPEPSYGQYRGASNATTVVQIANWEISTITSLASRVSSPWPPPAD